VTIAKPALMVNQWISAGIIQPADPDERLERQMDLVEIHDPSWRHEALCALRIFRHEAETGEPF
jgi:hypothetical protein